jgi:hypothetical protein
MGVIKIMLHGNYRDNSSLTIDSVDLATAMLYLVRFGSGKTTLENKALKRAAGKVR